MKTQPIVKIDIAQSDFTATAGKLFLQPVEHLSLYVEDILGDGFGIKLQKLRYILDINSPGGLLPKSFSCMPLIVQTAGTLTATSSFTTTGGNSLRDLLDNQVSDELAFEVLSDLKTSRFVNGYTTWNSSNNVFSHSIRMVIDIPQKFINILQKDANAERDQNLILAIVGGSLDGYAIKVTIHSETHYELTSKNITIR